MANFALVLPEILQNEGGYSKNPNDRGLETFCGISRVYWPNWPGWKIVDSVTSFGVPSIKQINEALFANPDIKALIQSFYKANFWDILKLDLMHDQQLASNVADFGVNAGVGTSAKKLQLAAGVTVDGQIGSITISAVNNGIAEDIYDKFNMLRKAYYMAIIERDPSQEQFKTSWLSRIKPYVK